MTVTCAGFEFLRSEHVQLQARKGTSLVVGGKSEYYRDAKKVPDRRNTDGIIIPKA